MKKKFALSFVALASVSLLAACGEVKSGTANAAGNTVEEKTIKIGFNFEETGAVAAYGTSEQKGAQLAVGEINGTPAFVAFATAAAVAPDVAGPTIADTLD